MARKQIIQIESGQTFGIGDPPIFYLRTPEGAARLVQTNKAHRYKLGFISRLDDLIFPANMEVEVIDLKHKAEMHGCMFELV